MLKRRRRIAAIVLPLLALLLAAAVWRCSRGGGAETGELHRSGFGLMSTSAELVFASGARGPFAAARDAMLEVESVCNVFDPSSELARLNAAAAEKPFVCSPMLYGILTESREAWRFSEGRFDITAGPLMRLWGFYRKNGVPKLPDEDEIAAASAVVGLDKVVFNDAERSVYFTVPGMSIDLGGIAKGYAADLAAERAEKNGAGSGAVNLGGNIRLLDGGTADGWPVAIRDPLNRTGVCETFTLHRGAVSTSGNYERYVVIDGRRYTHIMNPVTARPVDDMLAVTVTADTALRADWLSTSLFIGGEKLAEKAVAAYPEIRVWLFLPSADGAGCTVRRLAGKAAEK
ncbi:MAG: FAD:protein FMN transferase [Victivallaceae bacterium]|nr:FAD:protein FMN transferase [Victivallaceae bacterium]